MQHTDDHFSQCHILSKFLNFILGLFLTNHLASNDIILVIIWDFIYFPILPSDYLGRTEVRISEIHKETQGRGPITKSLLLHEVDTGEISVKLNLHLFEDS